MKMSLPVENISVKSARNLLLKKARLTYVIRDEVLQITSENNAKGRLQQRTYSVADLVVPPEPASLPSVYSLEDTLTQYNARMNGAINTGNTPFLGQYSLPNGQTVGTPGSSGIASSTTSGPVSAAPQTSPTKRGSKETIEQLLINLITNTVAPETWNAQGGPGTIQYYPLGMALVINQTQDVQEQIFDLLTALRRLQDLEVAVELRMISVSESFFERIGVDFSMNILTHNSQADKNELVNSSFQPFGLPNSFQPGRFVSGLTPAGTFTPDLNIPIKTGSFGLTTPPFGGYPGTLTQDGGISLGLAFLSDIQVFLFLEAAQGDRRINVMQAPKVTVFNGQTALMAVNDTQFFLVSITPSFTPFGNLIFTPNNVPIPVGITLLVTPVVSADRRFVRLNMTPTMTNLTSAQVPLFPVQFPVPLSLFGPGNLTTTGPPEGLFQAFFQQPSLTTITVTTTVNVPDGGTVLLGGLKTLNEGRLESGPPILSKIPYLDRLFKNVGYGRDAQSLMLMVTPRIIINEEEEAIFRGEVPPIPRP
jgi:type II secretory pathway component GspD/PulD (secretin)